MISNSPTFSDGESKKRPNPSDERSPKRAKMNDSDNDMELDYALMNEQTMEGEGTGSKQISFCFFLDTYAYR